MGYSTDFSGKLTISPPLQPHMVEEINLFCEERHGGPTTPFAGMPGFWCDWEVSEDGSKIYWNGSEKSYNMQEWIVLLINKFIKPVGSTVNGRMLAEGEDRTDTWVLDVDNSRVKVVPSPKIKALGITE